MARQEGRRQHHHDPHLHHHHHHHHSRQPQYSNDTPYPLDAADQDVHILVLGDRGCGKTCLNARYVLRQFVNTGDAAQLAGGQRLVTVEAARGGQAAATQVHLIVQDFPCGPCHATIDNRAPPGGVETTGNFIYATLQTDFRRALLTRADAVMLVCNPWSRSSFAWLNGQQQAEKKTPPEGERKEGDVGYDAGDGGIVHEVLEAARRKHLTRRVELLLDSLSETHSRSSSGGSRYHSRSKGGRAPAAPGDSAPQIMMALPGDEGRQRYQQSGRNRDVDLELEYPVLVVGTASDRLVENGGNLPRQVRRADGRALARRFRLKNNLQGGDEKEEEDDDDDDDGDGADASVMSRYMEVSARTADSVDEAYLWLIRRVLVQRARARERQQRRAAVAAVRRRAAEEADRWRQQRRTCGYWWLSAAHSLADPIVDWFRPEYGEPQTPNDPPSTGTTWSSSTTSISPRGSKEDIAHGKSSVLRQQEGSVDSRQGSSRQPPQSKAYDEALVANDDGDDDDGNDDAASLPSLVVDNLSLDYISIPDSFLFVSSAGSPTTSTAAGTALGSEVEKDTRG